MKVNNNEQRGINKKVIAKTIIFLFGVLILLMIRVFLKINLMPSMFISLLFVVVVVVVLKNPENKYMKIGRIGLIAVLSILSILSLVLR
ncbi:MAG: hypothetical protein E6502_00520 [Lactococcus lactis]|nr:hypothetical protein [Lactococcus lactis]